MDKEILEILKAMQQDMKSMKQDIASIKSTQKEHTQLLSALEHKTNVFSAENVR
ncbi:hypothetical protein [Clostridium sp. AWRP]|uniref:hypothetical protein n=1 Tax=Clostridium sp. AWRP TaxID=2212991 RepID=UPI001586E11D|nr:hypothetical protein [Clostridium sp. AWRP]